MKRHAVIAAAAALTLATVPAAAWPQDQAPEPVVTGEAECLPAGGSVLHWTLTNPTATTYTIAASSLNLFAGVLEAGDTMTADEAGGGGYPIFRTMHVSFIDGPEVVGVLQYLCDAVVDETTTTTTSTSTPATTDSGAGGAEAPPAADPIPAAPTFAG